MFTRYAKSVRLQNGCRPKQNVRNVGESKFQVRSVSFLSQKPIKRTITSQLSMVQVNTNLLKRTYSTKNEKVIKVPSMGDSISGGIIQKWVVKPGDAVKTDDLVVNIETDKIVVEIRAPEAGVITETFAKEGDNILVGADLFKVDTAAQPTQTKAPQPQSDDRKQTSPPQEKAQTQQPQQAAPKPSAPQPAPKPAAPTGSRTEHRVRMTSIRTKIAERLKGAQNTYAMLTTFNEIDMSNLTALRNQYKEEFEKKHGVKLGFMSAFIKASSAALKEFPIVNAVIDSNEIVYRDYVDVSVAVATPTGLVVPVLKNCDQMSFADVEKTLGDLGKRARENKIGLDEMVGGTFTISNGGVYGSMMGTPILNPPQSAILGMHAINKRAIVVNDQIVIRPMMYVALTYDHRLLDGKDAVTFLKKVKDLVEDPRRLLLDL